MAGADAASTTAGASTTRRVHYHPGYFAVAVARERCVSTLWRLSSLKPGPLHRLEG